MFRSTLIAAFALSAILGVGLARAQATPDTSATPPAAAPVEAAPDTAAAPVAPAAVAPAPAPAPAPVAPPTVYYEKARVVIDGKAEADGSLAMSFMPEGGDRKTFTVNVLRDAKKKDVARDIHKDLSIAAGSAYKVKLDGDKIRISKADKKKSPNFAVGVDKLEVGGVSVRAEKD